MIYFYLTLRLLFNNLRRGKIRLHHIISHPQLFSFINIFFLSKIGKYYNLVGIRLSFLIVPNTSKPSIPGITTSSKQLLDKDLL